MLRISLIVVGDKMPEWVTRGYQEYEKRIHGRTRLNLVEIPAGKRSKNADIPRIIHAEEQKIRDAIPHQTQVIALDRMGKTWSTVELSKRMQRWIDSGDQVALVVGGPEGLSNEFIRSANETWSLSSLTFAHPLVRVLLAEQLYRCHSILEGSPYHR